MSASSSPVVGHGTTAGGGAGAERDHRGKAVRVSVVTPTFNSAATLRACIASVAGQTFRVTEHLFIDGGSTDGTQEILADARREHAHIRIISEKDSGVYDAMNKGLAKSCGDYVYFLGSDDRLYAPTVLAEFFAELTRPDDAVLYGDVEVVGGAIANAAEGSRYGGEFNLARLLARNICHQAIFYPRSVIAKVGMYNLRYRIAADWEYNLRAFAAAPFAYRPVVVAAYNATGLSNTSDDLEFTYDFGDIVTKTFGGSLLSRRFQRAYATFGAAGLMRLRERKMSGLWYLLVACVHSPAYAAPVIGKLIGRAGMGR